MSSYIHFTEQEKEQARNTDLVDLLRRQGETLKKSGKEFQWKDGSDKVTVRGNVWFNQYEEIGGDAVDFVRRYFNMDFPEAMQFLLGKQKQGELQTSEPVVRDENKVFELPKKNDTMRRMFAYLTISRGLDRDVVSEFVKKNMIYESADYHNVVFVGYDMEGNPRHAHKRASNSNSTYRGNVEACSPEYSFHWHGTSRCLFLFEAPIDMLSFISLHKEGWQKHSYAACCGVSDIVLFQMLKDNPNLDFVYLCLDNDEKGLQAIERMTQKLNDEGIGCKPLLSETKDWNMDLTTPAETEEGQCIQQAM